MNHSYKVPATIRLLLLAVLIGLLSFLLGGCAKQYYPYPHSQQLAKKQAKALAKCPAHLRR